MLVTITGVDRLVVAIDQTIMDESRRDKERPPTATSWNGYPVQSWHVWYDGNIGSYFVLLYDADAQVSGRYEVHWRGDLKSCLDFVARHVAEDEVDNLKG